MTGTKRVRARLAEIVKVEPTEATNSELAEQIGCSTRMIQYAVAELRRTERVSITWTAQTQPGMPPARRITWTQTDDEGGAR